MQSAVWEMIEAGGRTVQSFGLNRLLGQIYVLLYLTEDAQSLDWIAQQLGVSKASASIACRQLEAWGAVHKSWKRGDRRDYYEAESDIGTMLRGGLLSSFNKKLESARTQIERSLLLLEKDGNGGVDVEFLRKRLREAESRRERIHSLLNNPLVKKLL